MTNQQKTSTLWKLAHEARNKGDREEALVLLEQIQALEPENVEAALEVAANLIELGKLELAIEHLPKDIDGTKHAGRAKYLLGRIHQGQLHLDDAISAYLDSISTEPDFLYSYLSLANLYIDQASFSAAEEIIQRALTAKVDHYWPQLLQVRVIKSKGFTYRALFKAKKLLADYPRDFHISLVLIDCLMKLGLLGEVSEKIKQVETTNDAQGLRLKMANAHLAWARYDLDLAITQLDEILEQDPQSIEVYDLLVLIYLMRCDITKAKIVFNKAVKVKESHALAHIRAEAKGGMNFMKLLDFSTNPFALKGLALAHELPLAQQIPAIAAVVETEPNHLGSCIALLTSLRQNHIFENSVPIESLTTGMNIPKSIIQFWDTKQIPHDLDLFMQSAKLMNPDFKHHVFDDVTAEEFIQKECGGSVLRAYRTANHPAMRADIFRLAYLCVKGGIYIDADDRCTNALSELLEPDYELIVMQEGDGSIGNNFIAVSPNHPWLLHVLDTVTSFVNQKQGDNIWLISGPGAVSGSFVRHYLVHFSQSKMPSGVKVLPQYVAERFISMHLPTHYKKAGGHWLVTPGRGNSLYTRSVFKKWKN